MPNRKVKYKRLWSLNVKNNNKIKLVERLMKKIEMLYTKLVSL